MVGEDGSVRYPHHLSHLKEQLQIRMEVSLGQPLTAWDRSQGPRRGKKRKSDTSNGVRKKTKTKYEVLRITSKITIFNLPVRLYQQLLLHIGGISLQIRSNMFDSVSITKIFSMQVVCLDLPDLTRNASTLRYQFLKAFPSMPQAQIAMLVCIIFSKGTIDLNYFLRRSRRSYCWKSHCGTRHLVHQDRCRKSC